MTDRQWEIWEERNMKVLLRYYGPNRARRELDKLAREAKKNEALLKSCKLHHFNWRKDVGREKERRQMWGVDMPAMERIAAASVHCRCKNCGGKVPVAYAAPYMDAVEQMKKNEGLKETQEKMEE